MFSLHALNPPRLLCIVLLLISACWQTYATPKSDPLVFDDRPLADALHLPGWFSLSFLNLQDSLNDALKNNKKGIILYFGRKDCAYCQALLETNWGDPEIVKFTQKHYHVIAIDVRGDRMVTDFNGLKWREKDFAKQRRTTFTPTLLFYNAKAQLALKLPGYRPKYQFRAALEYVADAHYTRESFRQYLMRAELALSFNSSELNEHDSFRPPPYQLNRQQAHPTQRKPLVVFFEQPNCHACDVLHGDTLSDPKVSELLKQLEVIQLNTHDEQPITTPAGITSSAKNWANTLDLTFAPSILFFDEKGREIIRVESVIRLFRLNNVLEYIIGEHYREFPHYQAWYHQTHQAKATKDSRTKQ